MNKFQGNIKHPSDISTLRLCKPLEISTTPARACALSIRYKSPIFHLRNHLMIKAFWRYFTSSARSSSNWRFQPCSRTSHALQTLKREFSGEYSLIIFDEHGIRYTEVGKTLCGKLEERFPFMSNTVPRWSWSCRIQITPVIQ